MTNMTYAQALEIALTAIGDSNTEATERIKALMGQLAKRGSKGGPTKTQKANEAFKAIILEILEDAEGFVLMADLMADERLADLSVQKMGALLGQLVKADKVVKQVYRKKTMYAIAGTEFVAPDAEVAEDEAE